MWPDRVSNQGPLTYESCALPTAYAARQVECVLEGLGLQGKQAGNHLNCSLVSFIFD